MSKKEINRMTIREIIKKVGIMLVSEQFDYILTDKAYVEQVTQGIDINLNKQEIQNFIQQNPDKIDKERLLFLTAKNLRHYINLGKRENWDTVEEKLALEQAKMRYEVAKKLLDGSDVEIPAIAKRGDRTIIKEFWTVNNFFLNKGDSEKQRKLKQENLSAVKDLQDTGMMDIIFNISSLDDFEDYLCYYAGNGKFLEFIITRNGNKRCNNIIEEEKIQISDEEKYEILIDQCRIEFDEVMYKYCEKFNIEKLLLVSAYRVKDILDVSEDFSVKEMQKLVEFLEYAESHIQNPKMKIHEKVYLKTIDDKADIEYSYKELQQDLSRVVTAEEGKYYFPKRSLEKMKCEVLNGEFGFEKVNHMQVFELLNFSTEEKNKLVEINPTNFEHLLMLDALNREEIHNIIKHRLGDYKINQIHLCYLYDNDFIENSDIIEMYMQDHVELSKVVDFSFMNENFDTEISVEKLMEYYKKAKEEPEKAKDFDCYRLLFCEVKSKGKSPEQQSQIAEQIAMQICELESEYEDFKNLYQSSLLPIDTLLEWNGEEVIYDLIQSAHLKPRDAKNLLFKGELDLEKACHALKTSNLSDEEKLNFIFSSFNGAGKNIEQIRTQNDARMYLIQALNVSNEMVQGQKNSTTTRTKSQTTKKQEANRYVTDPIYRWQLFSELDEDCEIELYLDGTAKVSLPNLDKIILEKLFKSTKMGTKINYGAATYMMKQEEFYKNQNNIVEDGKVNRRFLVEMGEKEEADRFVHSSKWGKVLKENLEISLEKGYSQEKIERIDKLVDQIEKARELTD